MLQTRFAPPVPPLPSTPPRGLAVLRAIRGNVLGLWSADAYRDKTYANQIFGARKIHLFNEPEAVRHVLVENDENYARSPIRVRILRPVVGEGVLLSEGDSWRQKRRALAPAFAPRAVPAMTGHFAEGAQETVHAAEALNGAPLDLFGFLHGRALAMAIKSLFSFGQDDFLVLREFVHRYLGDFARPYMLDVLMPPGMTSPHDFLRRRFQREWMGTVDGMIERRLVAPPNDPPVDLLDLLRTTRTADGSPAFTRAQMRDEVATMIVVGHETTASSLFWSTYLVATAPGVRAQIAAEVRELDLSPERAGETLPKLVYTRALVDEALRLYPAAFMIVRQAIADDEIGGVRVPAGSTVMVAPWVLHRHHAYWSDPDVFDPGRFLPGATPPQRFTYLPFGTGPRVCLGAHFATAMTTIMVARLVQAFDIEVEDAAPVLPVCVTTVRPSYPVRMRLVRRVGRG